MTNVDNCARLVEGMIRRRQRSHAEHGVELIQSRDLGRRLNDIVRVCMRGVANTKTVKAESAIAVSIDRDINVAVVEVVVRKIPVSLVKTGVEVS